MTAALEQHPELLRSYTPVWASWIDAAAPNLRVCERESEDEQIIDDDVPISIDFRHFHCSLK